jgi:hypothetical protein
MPADEATTWLRTQLGEPLFVAPGPGPRSSSTALA